MQTAPVTARTFASPWSITPSATVPIVATVRSPERIPTKPSSPFPPKTSSASAEMLASATRLRLRVESVRATPDVQSAVTSVMLWRKARTLSAQLLSGATEMKTNETMINPSTTP